MADEKDKKSISLSFGDSPVNESGQSALEYFLLLKLTFSVCSSLGFAYFLPN
jgi:hypothetical protein